MPSDRVRIDFRKYPDAKHWQYDLLPLAEDEYGHWLWGPPGTVAQRGDEAPITFDYTNVKLVSRDWWAAIWSTTGEPEVYVDICTPACWGEDRVTMVDLDLDLIRLRSGAVRLLDEDEFEAHQVELGYPRELVEGALAAAERVRAMLIANEEPFGSAGDARLAEALALQEEPEAPAP